MIPNALVSGFLTTLVLVLATVGCNRDTSSDASPRPNAENAQPTSITVQPAVTTSATTSESVNTPETEVLPKSTTTVPTSDDPPSTVSVSKPEVAIETVMTLSAPIDMAVTPGDNMAWIAERAGRVLRVDLDRGEVVEVVVDISDETTTDNERGLLGIAVTSDWLYASFTDINGDSRVDAFKRQGTGLGSERHTLLTLQQPYANHNGGALAFGEDGYLYIGFGDGGSTGDPHAHGQNPNTWLGSMLRINPTPNTDHPYSIPNDNPYASGREGLPEVFLIGLRNPWRFSFDAVTGDLWIADVGNNLYEEVTVLRSTDKNWAGSNLGWNLREGKHPYSYDTTDELHHNTVDPIWEYDHSDGCSITGGFVYRGSAIADLYGSYVFGDYCTSRLWALDTSPGSVVFTDLNINVPGGQLASFGQDSSGEIYTLSLSGDVAQIIAK